MLAQLQAATINIPASLVAAAALTLVSYAATTPVVAVAPSPETRTIPIGVAVVLIGLFTLGDPPQGDHPDRRLPARR